MARQIRHEAKQASAEARLQASALPIFRDRSQPAPDKDNLDILSFLLKREYSAVRERVERGDFDFDCFQRFVARSQLRGYIYSVLADSTVRSAFPARLVDDLRSSYARGKKKGEDLLRELTLLSSKLTVAGQEFILLKGPYLAARFYGGIDRRTYWDIDVLVKRESLKQVQQLLTDSGYVRRSHVLVHERLSSYFTHAFDFAIGAVNLDLHWALSIHPSYRLNYQEIWMSRQPFYFADIRFFVLSDEYELVFNLISTFRDMERGALRLRSFVDLYMILKGTSLDWSDFFERRKRENVSRICLNTLALFLNVLDCRDDFPQLATSIDREKDNRPDLNNRETAARLITPSRFGLRNKLWTFRSYETSALRAFLWWATSLPFRLVVYRPGKLSRFKRNIRRWIGRRN